MHSMWEHLGEMKVFYHWLKEQVTLMKLGAELTTAGCCGMGGKVGMGTSAAGWGKTHKVPELAH